MPNTYDFSHPQDELGTILSVPLGTESIAPRDPEPIIEPSAGLSRCSTVAVEGQACQHNQSSDSQSGGGKRLLLVLGAAAFAACASLGLLTWLR